MCSEDAVCQFVGVQLLAWRANARLGEAGLGRDAIISSVSALSILINKGIGDTIRVSLTPESIESRTEEVEVCQQILSSLGLRNYTPRVISCPGCGRTSNTYFVELTKSCLLYKSQAP